MNTPLPTLRLPMTRFGGMGLIGLFAAVLALEVIAISYVVRGTPITDSPAAEDLVRAAQHLLFRFVIAYAVSMAMLVYLRGPALLSRLSAVLSGLDIRPRWALAHAVTFCAVTALTVRVYDGLHPVPFLIASVGWHALAAATAISLLATIAPLGVWRQAFASTGSLRLLALVPAAAAVALIQASQLLWVPTAALTFRLVTLLLVPFLPDLQTDYARLAMSTDGFEITVSSACSGLEGVGLMLIFCSTWLWYFRREYYFPRALIIIPCAALLIFLLNAVRIAMLVLIGNAGYLHIATMGFHSQAGWIAFNLAAFGVAVIVKRSTWLHRHDDESAAATEPESGSNLVAPYLMPLLAILAAGMVAHAMSAGFDLLYPLRLVAAVVALYAYRRCYPGVDWRFSWRALAVGTLVFGVWAAAAHFMTTSSPAPEALTSLTPGQRGLWIACRVAAAIVTVPIAEELAYRGFLMRRLLQPDFQALDLTRVPFTALGVTSLVFGITHGGMWLPGILAGLAYGTLAIRTGRLGEAMAAHGMTNALLAGYVLLFDQWQLW